MDLSVHSRNHRPKSPVVLEALKSESRPESPVIDVVNDDAEDEWSMHEEGLNRHMPKGFVVDVVKSERPRVASEVRDWKAAMENLTSYHHVIKQHSIRP